MKREIRTVDQERSVICLTVGDERWYHRVLNRGAENEMDDFVPSVTWICSAYPKGDRFVRWVGKIGNEAAEEAKELGGDRGSKVHQAVRRIVYGGVVSMEDYFENPNTLEMEQLKPKEYFAVQTFAEWFEKERPRVIACEITVWNEKYRYAGTLDLLAELKSDEYRFPRIIDVKTSQNIYPEMELQVSAYKHADLTLQKNTCLGILQVGYEKNKTQKYKFTPVVDQFSLFLATRKIWAKEARAARPFQREYPLSISLSPELCLKENV